MDDRTLEEQIAALEDGRALVDRTDQRLVRVSGNEARSWLQDLLTADIETLEASSVRRSLLLTPSGHIRADLHAFGMDDGAFVLAQSRDQPHLLADLLAPYVLSSDVRLQPAPLLLLSVPGPWAVPAELESIWSPSTLGEGFDVLARDAEAALIRDLLRSEGRVEVQPAAVEIWRVRRGAARFPADLDEGSIPAEAGLESLIDLEKGCFLGQESVAKVRNLGHPPRVVLSLRSDVPVHVGQQVSSRGEPVGTITSAVPDGQGGSAVLARVRWEDRDAELTVSGAPLRAA